MICPQLETEFRIEQNNILQYSDNRTIITLITDHAHVVPPVKIVMCGITGHALCTRVCSHMENTQILVRVGRDKNAERRTIRKLVEGCGAVTYSGSLIPRIVDVRRGSERPVKIFLVKMDT